MRPIRIALTIVFCIAAEGAPAQMLESVARCRTIQDEALRLRCYDNISLPTTSPLSKYEAVDLDELKDYALSYRGRLVEVGGGLRPSGTYLFLGANADDASAIPVEVEALPRREREVILEACADGCEGVVQGRVRPVNFTTGIVADEVIVR